MKPNAIVYTSRTGHTRQYAAMLAERLALPVHSLDEAKSALPEKSAVIYLGWLRANRVQGYARAKKRFTLCAVCGVGLCDTGTLTDQVRKASSIPAEIPLFTLQGGFDSTRQKGFDKLIISMLTKGLSNQKERTAQDERILELLRSNASYVSKEHLKDVLDWFGKA